MLLQFQKIMNASAFRQIKNMWFFYSNKRQQLTLLIEIDKEYE